MLSPTDVRLWASQRLSRQRRSWVDGGGTWPLIRGLEPPTAVDIRAGLGAVTEWTSAWAARPELVGVRVVRETRLMKGIGNQTMPVRIEFDTPRAVAAFAGEVRAWDRVEQRRARLLTRWPSLVEGGGLGRLYDWMDQADDGDVDRLVAVAGWVIANPSSGLYLRQLPVEGVDTKWIEGGHRRAIASLVAMLQGDTSASGETEKEFLRLCGLCAPAPRIRVLVLDQELRCAVGGIRDMQAPQAELAALRWAPHTTLFVENLQCAHSLPDIKSTVAVAGLGRAISLAVELPWVRSSRTFYWGDLDTHGLEILSLARSQLPGIQSVLMDGATLRRYQSRWVSETVINRQASREHLLPSELAVYDALLANDWPGWNDEGGVRLEQERLDWPHVVEELRGVLIGQDG